MPRRIYIIRITVLGAETIDNDGKFVVVTNLILSKPIVLFSSPFTSLIISINLIIPKLRSCRFDSNLIFKKFLSNSFRFEVGEEEKVHRRAGIFLESETPIFAH